MARVENTQATPEVGYEPFAWKALSLIASALAVPLVLTIGKYGYTEEELYFVAAGRFLDWGYADQGPFVPLVAWLMDGLAPGSVFFLRLPDVFVLGAGVLVAGQLAREMGGRGRAQAMTGAAYGIAFMTSGTVLDTDTFSDFFWMLCFTLVARWVRLREQDPTGRSDDAPLLWAGVVSAVALQVKFLTPILWLALGLSALAVGPRDLLRRPKLWIGLGIAVVATTPALIWQATHGWPQLAMTAVLAEENAYFFGESRWMFFYYLLLMTGLGIGTLLVCYGLWQLLRSPDMRAFRFLGWTALGVAAVVFAVNGRFTYVIGVFPVLFAAAAVQLQMRRPAIWWRWAPTWPVFALSALLPLAQLNWEPVEAIKQPATEEEMLDSLTKVGMLGWPDFVASVARAYQSLPAEERGRTTILAETFGHAGVLEVLGTRDPHLLPRPYSANRAYGYFAVPEGNAGSVLIVGSDGEYLRKNFRNIRQVGEVTGTVGTAIGLPIWAADGGQVPWSRLWPELRRLNIL
jgi:hypothetical protein